MDIDALEISILPFIKKKERRNSQSHVQDFHAGMLQIWIRIRISTLDLDKW